MSMLSAVLFLDYLLSSTTETEPHGDLKNNKYVLQRVANQPINIALSLDVIPFEISP